MLLLLPMSDPPVHVRVSHTILLLQVRLVVNDDEDEDELMVVVALRTPLSMSQH